MVTTQAWGWFGARQARELPTFVEIAVCWTRRLGGVSTYGIGGRPPPPMPPLPQLSDCHAVMVPSFFAPILAVAKHEGREP
jgi:hypothetical protein